MEGVLKKEPIFMHINHNEGDIACGIPILQITG